MAQGMTVVVRDRRGTAAVEYAVLFGALAVAITAAAGPVMTDMGERLARIRFDIPSQPGAAAAPSGIPDSCGYASTCQGTVIPRR